MKYTTAGLAGAYIRHMVTDTGNTSVNTTFSGFDDDGPWATSETLAADKALAFLNNRVLFNETPGQLNSQLGAWIRIENPLAGGQWICTNTDGITLAYNGLKLVDGTGSITSVTPLSLPVPGYGDEYNWPTGYLGWLVLMTGTWVDNVNGNYAADAYFIVTGVPGDATAIAYDPLINANSDDYLLFDYCGYNVLQSSAATTGTLGLLFADMTPSCTVPPADILLDDYISAVIMPGSSLAGATFQLAWKSDARWHPKPGEPYPLKYENTVSIITMLFDTNRHGVVRPSKDGGFIIYEVDGAGVIISLCKVFRQDRTLAAVINKELLLSYLPKGATVAL